MSCISQRVFTTNIFMYNIISSITFLGGLREVTLDLAKRMADIGRDIIPGSKLCPNCKIEFLNRTTNESTADSDNTVEDDISIIETTISIDTLRSSLNSTLENIEISPFKTHAVASHSLIQHGRKKLQQSKVAFNQKQDTIKSSIANLLEIEDNALNTSSDGEADKDMKTKANDLDRLMSLLKEKINISKSSDKIQLLTLVPTSWTYKRMVEEFSVTEYMVRCARKLLSEKGILATTEPKRGYPISKELINLVVEFYSNDEFSRIMPGKNDYVSIGKNNHVQKRLILSNLKEMYAMFKEEHPQIKIGFSKFCSLRPKWCILVGASGSHSVCVCTIHQNVLLLVKAVNLDYHDLIDMIVCDHTSRECMIHRCEICPGLA